MASLYELTQEHAAMIAAVIAESEDGEVSDETMAELIAMDEQFDSKVEACCKVVRNLETLADGIAAEVKRLTDRKRVTSNKVARLKEYIGACMAAADRREAGGVIKATVAKGRQSVEITDPVQVPKRFIRNEPKIMKSEIAAALKAGEAIPGVALVTGKDSIRIK